MTKYRLGRKQKRIILTQDGTIEIAFVKGNEELAQIVVNFLNSLPEEPDFRGLVEKIPTISPYPGSYNLTTP
jgi:hypothetical protein